MSALALSSASAIASYIAAVSAFFLSGRFIRTVRTGPASVTVMCSLMPISAASAALTLSAPSVTARSSPDACTAMFSAKKRAMATREAGSPLAMRSAASASSASMQPPAALPNSRR